MTHHLLRPLCWLFRHRWRRSNDRPSRCARCGALFIVLLVFSPLLSARPAINYGGAALTLGDGCTFTLSATGAVRITCATGGVATLRPRST